MFSYSILAVIDAHEEAIELARRLRQVDRAIIELGGKSYLSGRVGYGRHEWEEHYEGMLDIGSRWKRDFDPMHLFRNDEMPFGERPSTTDPRSGNNGLGRQVGSDIG